MRTKQKIAAALLITAVFVMGSCSKKEQAAENGGQIRLKVAHWDVSASGCITAITEAFREENPDIPVEIIDIPLTDYTQKLQIMLNGGSDVDVFWIKDGGVTKSLYNRGQLADMSAYAGRDNIDLAVYNGLAERFVIDEKLVALPASVGYYVLYYNKSIFDRAGIPYPSNDMTWDEWESLAARVTSGNGSNKVYGGFFHTWQACVQNWALQDGKHTVMETDYSFFKPYYEMALRMQNAGIVWDYGSLKNSGIHYSSAFLQGNVAMMPMGTWFYSVIIGKINKGESNIRWGLATLPHPPQTEAGWTVGSVTPIAINRASQYKAAAWEFVKFVTGGKGAGIYAEYGLIPARADDKALTTIAMSSGMPEGALEALTVKNIALDRPMADQAAEINLMLGQEHSLIMLKEVSIDKGLQNMSRRSKEIQSSN
jgi:multiple sugar transport system substrate-binding protein